jgi:3-methylcrotonyl-CoA carboxylase alpha subunit
MFSKILIANRGEIACRIIRTARRMGIESVAVYSSADPDSLHVVQADQAFCIGPPAASASYLNIEAIIKAAKESEAQAIHPGYGFLSENSHFARACADANIVFIGPSIHAMEAMASKQLAKQLLEKTAVPLTPGYHGNDQTDERLRLEAQKIGFPVLLKAAAGGGGKGMRAVYLQEEFAQALAAARRESKASFADDTMLLEKLIQQPRHVEMQIFADNHGNVVHLFERDCSIQRRHQKIIEEARAPSLSPALQKGLSTAAVEVAKTINYRGAGTVEFLVADDQYYFMEMNTRLQVEHPVTEMITGLDLVEWQIRVAAGEILPLTQEQIAAHGHAIECRIYAEDPQHDFLPSTGQISFLKEPSAQGLRIDTGVTLGSNISMYYDPMIAKIIAWGNDRTEALQRLQQALRQYHLGGLKTNLPFLKAILLNPKFINDQLSTDFLSQETIEMSEIDPKSALYFAAGLDYYFLTQNNTDALAKDTFAWQMHLKSQWRSHYLVKEKKYDILITPLGNNQLSVTDAEETQHFWVHLEEDKLTLDNGAKKIQAWVENHTDYIIFYTELGFLKVERYQWQLTAETHEKEAQLTAPMPATVVAILKQKGDKIRAGERLMILEAMKMEHTIHAPKDGVLREVFYDIGSQVSEGAELLALDSEAEPTNH